MNSSEIEELHRLSRNAKWQELWARVSPYVTGFLVLFVFVMVEGYVQVQDERANLVQQVAAYKERGCPAELDGKPFRFSAHESVALNRPGYDRLSCYYKEEQS